MRPDQASQTVRFGCTGHLASRTLLLTLAVFLVLEAWRPCYFLTDDNLSVGLPFLTEMGRHIKSGQSPFFSEYLFGGHYDFLRDANYFSWSPVNFAVSLLSDTPGRFLMLDLIALLNLLLTAAGFLLLATGVRAELGLQVPDGRLIFYTLSFVYSTFILTCGSSWVNFMANQAVLPWLALGLWQRDVRPALGLLILFSVYQALTGQSAATISNGLILTLFAGLMCFYRRGVRPLAFWLTANVATLIIILPVLLPALGGFLHSQRGEGLSIELMQRFAVPAPLFPVSFLLGNFFEMVAWFGGIHRPNLLPFPRTPTLLACAAAWCVFPAIFHRRRWTLLETGCAVLMLLIAILVIRPPGITVAMAHVPILRSMRWPFREILQLLFFLHLFLVLRPPAGSPAFYNRISFVSLTLFVLPLFYSWPLSLNPLLPDRQALFSGQADRFWAVVKAQLRPGDQMATVIEPKLWLHSQYQLPYSLTGTADFPAYFRVHTISGYSQTSPLDQMPIPVRPYFWFGAYDPTQVAAITHGHPEVRILTVKSISPLVLELSTSFGGPPQKLIPLLSK